MKLFRKLGKTNRTRKLFAESLEERTLLAVTAGAIQSDLIVPETAQSVWVVNTLDDPSSWNDADEIISLREAIASANENDTIIFDSSLAGGTIILEGGQLEISKGITIDASEIGKITIDGNGKIRCFSIIGVSEESVVAFTNLVISGGYNSEDIGAGILINGEGTVSLSRCLVTGNVAASGKGGGIYIESGNLSAVNTLICANTAGIGAGIYAGGGSFTAVNCTIAANSASNYGGGVANWGTVTMTNTIVSRNSGVYQNPDWFGVGADPDSSNNIIGFDAKFTVNPLFDEEGNLTNSDSYDLTLSSSSWGIDRGTNSAVYETVDYAGNSRIVQARGETPLADIGAFEYQDSFLRLTETESLTVTTLLDLVDDTDNLISLREAILYAEEGDTIFFSEELAGGTIYLADAALMIGSQITIDASFLEGGITIDGNSKTAVFVVSGGSGESPVVLKGISVANGASYDGGGILNSGRLLVSDSSVSGCDAAYGAGIFNFEGDITCTNVIFTGNTAASALYSYYGTVTVDHCTFTENKASRGAAIYLSGGTAAVSDSSMTGNSATYGGAIQNMNGVITISGSLISDNSSYYGGAVCNNGKITIIDTVISGNNAYYNGGGIYNYLGVLNATNLLMYGNTAGFGGGVCVDQSTFNAVNCTITGNDSYQGGGIFVNGVWTEDGSKDYAVVLCNTIVVDNTANYGDGDIQHNNTNGTVKGVRSLSSFTEWDNGEAGRNLVYDSTKRLFCDPENSDYQLVSGAQGIDYGENNFVSEIEHDLAGNARIVNEIVDLGVYEYQRTLETPSAVVTTDLDVVDEYDGLISLREAVLYIKYGKTAETAITFNPWLAGKTITLDSDLGSIVISKSITIDASYLTGGITVSGGGKTRVFMITDDTASESPVSMIGIVVTGGSAEYGAGIMNYGFLQMTNSIICGNNASSKGGGICNIGISNSGGNLILTNTTITANTAAEGAGLWYQTFTDSESNRVILQNSILAENRLLGGSAAGNADFVKSGSMGIVYAYNTISSYTDWDNASEIGVINYEYNPALSLFADPKAGDYSLASDSQVIDLGDNVFVSAEVDLRSETRIVNRIVDLGAYEYLFNDDPGDTLELAETIELTDAAYSRREMIGNGLYGDKDVDIYAIEIGPDDLTRIYTISVSEPVSGTLLDTLIRVFDSEGEELGNSGENPFLYWTHEETGRFYIAVSALANNEYDPLSADERVSGETGDYLLNISYSERTPLTGVELSETELAVGAVLSASYQPEEAQVTWQWVRGTDPESMEAIEGATETYYEVTSDDVGYYIGVQVTGYANYVGTLTAVTEEAVPEFEKCFVVDTLLDVVSDDGYTSLREAIAYADEGETITFDPSLDGGTIQLDGYAVTINKLINIDASALENGISISAGGKHRVLMVTAGQLGSNVTLTGITIRDGYATYGGGIYNTGYLELVHSKVTDCTAVYGGGIYNYYSWDAASHYTTGFVGLTHSSVESCYATYGGGGIWSNMGGIVNLKYSKLIGNEAQIGAGMYNYYGSCSTSNSLIASNTASKYGGGLFIDQGSFFIYDTTIAGNSAAYAGGVYNYSTESYQYSVEFLNSIVAGNTATKDGADILCEGDGDVLAYNALSSFTGWTNTDPETYVSYIYDPSKPLFVNPGIGDYSLIENSQAIDIGNNSYAEGDTDLAGNDRISNGIVDLGAYEFQTELPQLDIPVILTGQAGNYISAGANRQSLLWSEVDGAIGYEIEWSADGIIWQIRRETETSALFTGLTYGTEVSYRVRALGDQSLVLNSEWSAVKSFVVCPVDINGDDDISGADRVIMSGVWHTEEGDEGYLAAADIDGDGDIGGSDFNFLASNWNKEVGDDDIIYPKALDLEITAADSFFESFEELL